LDAATAGSPRRDVEDHGEVLRVVRGVWIRDANERGVTSWGAAAGIGHQREIAAAARGGLAARGAESKPFTARDNRRAPAQGSIAQVEDVYVVGQRVPLAGPDVKALALRIETNHGPAIPDQKGDRDIDRARRRGDVHGTAPRAGR